MLNTGSFAIPFYAGSSRITVDTALTTADASRLKVIDSSVGNVTITLPNALSLAIGTHILFSTFNINTESNTVSFIVLAGNTLNGVAAPGTFTADASIDNGGMKCVVTGANTWEATRLGQ